MELRRNILEKTSYLNPIQVLFYVGLIVGVIGIMVATAKFGMVAGVAIGVAPLALGVLYFSVRKPVIAFLTLFTVNYLIMALSRHIPDFPVGILLDALIAYNLFILILHAMLSPVHWKRAYTWLSLLALIWMLYGILELFNPQTVSTSGWFSSVRSISFHFFFIVVLGQIVLDNYRYLRYLLFIWSLLTLMAVGKALIQKYIGFNNAEYHWLYVLGGHVTHMIYSGTRYFSFFSDAANFSASMGLSMVVFSISAIYVRNPIIKAYMLLVAAIACYGMLLSGTRSALAVPFAGYAFYIFMSKRIKIMFLGTIAILAMFVFFKYTHIGEGNAIIRRARSAFNPNDPSLVVRLENQKKLRELMWDKPFGAGIGHGGGKAKAFAPDAPISQIPTDSWFVLVWVETGVVGILLHILILGSIISYGAFLVMFRLRSEQIRGMTAAFTSGIVGIVAMSYANEIFGQIPNGMIMYTSMALIFLSPRFDEQLLNDQSKQNKSV